MTKTYSNEKLKAFLADPEKYIERLVIRDKNGLLVQFGNVLTKEQRMLIHAIHNNKRVAIVKARQLGITTLVRAYSFWENITKPHSFYSAVLSNKAKSAHELLKIDKRFHEHLPSFLQREMGAMKRDELNLASTKSKIQAFSGAASNDRGYTLNSIHMSEFAFMENAHDVLASMLATVNNGRLIIESTPNYYGDALHNIITNNTYSQAYEVIMLPWFTFPDYRKEIPRGGFVLEPEEENLIQEYGLDLEQVYWRRNKIAETKDEHRFKREYPVNVEEAYSLSGRNYFSENDLKHIKVVEATTAELNTFQPIDYNNEYVIGVDPAAGVGNDYSCAYVLDKKNLAPVAVYWSNKVPISTFAEQVMKLSMQYKNAKVICEENNHGYAVREVFNANSFYKYEMFKTTAKSKLALYDQLRTYMVDRIIETLDKITLTEMRNLINSDNGTAPTHPPSAHDDRVVAYMLALHGLKNIRLPANEWDKLLHGATKPPPNAQLPNSPFARK